MKKKRVVVGFSGGVDSTITAKTLIDRGFEVIAVFLENFDDPSDLPVARRVAEQSLEIQFFALESKKFFKKNVIDDFHERILSGKTPNPCVFCNKILKFGRFLDVARKKFDADFLATGHYAKLQKNESGKFELRMPADLQNDQTYFLHQLDQNQFSKILFPLADFKKNEVRVLARECGLPNFNKKSSSDICFLKNEDYNRFVHRNFPKKHGKIIHFETGRVLGEHPGAHFFTIGQRKNLGIGGVRGLPESPFFVVERNPETREVKVSQNPELLRKKIIEIENLNWISGESPQSKKLTAKIRFRGILEPCKIIEFGGASAKVEFEKPIFAPAVGQFCVFYDKNICLGGGEITGF